MAPPSEILIVIHYHGQIAYNLIQGLMYSCANPIFLYVSRSITLTQLIRKINNRLPTRATETVVQLLYRIPISFHHGQTHFISRQIHDNDDLRRMLETIFQNAQLKFVELYVVTDLIPQPQPPSPQPSCPQLQLLSPQQLLYNNLDLNDPMSSYNNLETQEVFDIYTSYTQLLSQNDSYFDAQETSFDKKKTIIHHNILRHPYHNNHKHKHQIKMNISSLMKISLYDFMKKTWMILVSLRIKSRFITIMTKAMIKAMMRVLSYQHYLHCNITNLGVQWS